MAKKTEAIQADKLQGKEEEAFLVIDKPIEEPTRFNQYYLCLEENLHEDGLRHPFLLGTGRQAVVFLARSLRRRDAPGQEYFGIKFVKKSLQKEYHAINLQRFNQEVHQTEQNAGRGQSFFLTYRGRGAIGRHSKSKYDEAYDGNDSDYLEYLANYYDLNGEFYLVQLAVGTLHDILERGEPWTDISGIYSYLDEYNKIYQSHYLFIKKDFEEFCRDYIKQERSSDYFTGYDIINSIHEEHPDIRNYIVLRTFSTIVDQVDHMHRETAKPGEDSNSVMHRDLKPGNIFFIHSYEGGTMSIAVLKLGDMGYVATLRNILDHQKTLANEAWRSTSVPGSLFYRATEQIQLPIEARITLTSSEDSPADDTIVKATAQIRSSKLFDIDKEDWLTIDDNFGAGTSRAKSRNNVFQILRAEKTGDGRGYDLEIEIKGQLLKGKTKDLQGHVIKATSYHTDGFSLGAILYDLISGGKNPEDFYNYCLARFHRSFEDVPSIGVILDIFAPQTPDDSANNITYSEFKLTFGKKISILRAMAGRDVSLESILQKVIDTIPTPLPADIPQNSLSNLTKLVNSHKEAKFDDMMEALFKALQGNPDDLDHLTQALKNYRYREFPIVSELLKDKNGKPIPRDILEIIIKCMLRNLDGSYYSNQEKLGYFDPAQSRKIEDLQRDVNRLLDKGPGEKIPKTLKEAPLPLLRMYWHYTETNNAEKTAPDEDASELPPEGKDAETATVADPN